MTTEKATVKSEAVFSDDKQFRYLMTKLWDKNKPIVTVISISPSALCGVEADLTCSLIQNNLCKLDLGGFELVNLLSKIGVDGKKCKDIAAAIGEETDRFIKESVERTSMTVLSWGRIGTMNKSFHAREEEVMELLKPYTHKLQIIVDAAGREHLHPLTPSVRNGWLLQPFCL